jgi:IS4 transposase
VFLTDYFKLSAKDIADIYKERWQFEILFRWLKQNLKIKAVIDNSQNAVLSQIFAALLVYLLLCYLKFLCNLVITLQNLRRLLQFNLLRMCSFKDLFEPPSPPADIMCRS